MSMRNYRITDYEHNNGQLFFCTPNYEVADKWFDAESPITYRLCEDCLSIRATNEGERLVPMASAAH